MGHVSLEESKTAKCRSSFWNGIFCWAAYAPNDHVITPPLGVGVMSRYIFSTKKLPLVYGLLCVGIVQRPLLITKFSEMSPGDWRSLIW